MYALADLICVPPENIRQVWPHCAEFIRRAMERGDLGEFADVEHGILNGSSFLWVAWDGAQIIAAAVTQLDRINGRKVLTIVACGGRDWSKFGHHIAGLEKFARDEGCAASRINGRRGWAKMLPDYRIRRVVLEKDLT